MQNMEHDHNNNPHFGVVGVARMHETVPRRFEGMLCQIDDGLVNMVGQ